MSQYPREKIETGEIWYQKVGGLEWERCGRSERDPSPGGERVLGCAGARETGWVRAACKGVRPRSGVKSSREAGFAAPESWSGMGAPGGRCAGGWEGASVRGGERGAVWSLQVLPPRGAAPRQAVPASPAPSGSGKVSKLFFLFSQPARPSSRSSSPPPRGGGGGGGGGGGLQNRNHRDSEARITRADSHGSDPDNGGIETFVPSEPFLRP